MAEPPVTRDGGRIASVNWRASRWVSMRVAAAVELGRECARRAIEIEFVDRSIALASLAFTALIPLGVVLGAFLPRVEGRSFANGMVERFNLDDSSAELVQSLFAPASGVESNLSIAGLILVVVSALAFTRALQRVYERAWGLRTLGVRATPAGLKWLGIAILYFVLAAGLRRGAVEALGPVLALVVAITSGTLIWLVTPAILLSGRVSWRSLLPTAILTGTAMAVLGAMSALYMPESIAASAASYGQVGVAIAIVSWFVVVGFALVICAAVGVVIAERLGLEAKEPTEVQYR